MDRPTARIRLASMVAQTSAPVLSDAQLDALLDTHPTPDYLGVYPTTTGYLPTWDLNAAASEGWGWKAGIVAGDYTFSADGASYSKADVLTHCTEREAFYAGKVMGTMATSPYGSRYGRGTYEGDYIAGELIP